MTRYRASQNRIPLPITTEYYAQRACIPSTLLITEATFIHALAAGGSMNSPGIYTTEQMTAWKTVTDAVHERGSFIFCQLWGLGRFADGDVARGEGFEVLGTSSLVVGEGDPVPREMTVADIERFKGYFVQAARNAVEAGFDGIELHAPNGFLLDQFISDVSNQRTDEYGGSIENRARFVLEVVDAVSSAVGREKVGIRMSPLSTFQNMKMEDPIPQFTYLVQRLRKLDTAYIHLVESRVCGTWDTTQTESLDFAIQAWGPEKPVLLAGVYSPAAARAKVEEYRDFQAGIVFGRYFIANPDLVFRIRRGWRSLGDGMSLRLEHQRGMLIGSIRRRI